MHSTITQNHSHVQFPRIYNTNYSKASIPIPGGYSL